MGYDTGEGNNVSTASGDSPQSWDFYRMLCVADSAFQISGEAGTTIGCLEGSDAPEVNRELCYFKNFVRRGYCPTKNIAHMCP